MPRLLHGLQDPAGGEGLQELQGEEEGTGQRQMIDRGQKRTPTTTKGIKMLQQVRESWVEMMFRHLSLSIFFHALIIHAVDSYDKTEI